MYRTATAFVAHAATNLATRLSGLTLVAYMLLGAAPATALEVFDNGRLRFGTGAEASVNVNGNFQQPFYYDGSLSQWFKLTYSSYPLDNAIGIEGVGTSEWNISGTVVQNSVLTNQVLDVSGFTITSGSKGYGTIVSTGTVTIAGKALQLRNTYELGAANSFVKITTRLTNTSGTSVGNVRVWVGTRDDWVGTSDSPTKLRGNLGTDGFTGLASAADRAAALRITSGATGVLFYSTSPKAHTSIHSCCSFSNAYNQNPATSNITATNDGSYALFVRMDDLADGASEEFTWYYAAGPLSSLDDIVGEVVEDQAPPSNFAVTASAGTGGAISPTSIDVASGSTALFGVTLNEGYHIDSVQGCGGALSGTTFTTSAITAACAITASFSLNNYEVTATADTGGGIGPSSATVNHGGTTSFALTTDTGYSITSVQGCGGILTGVTYVTGAISATCSVTATFHRTPPTISPTQTAAISLNASQLFTLSPIDRPQAFDFAGNPLEVTLVGGQARYEPGEHVLTWTATDVHGVITTVEQILRIWPTVSFGPNITIGGLAGNYDFFRIALNGRSPVYPLNVDYIVSGDLQGHDLRSGSVTFSEGEVEKEIGFTISSSMLTGAADKQVQLAFAQDVNRNSDAALTVTITARNDPPTVSLAISQLGEAHPSAARDSGPITITANVHDPNTSDTHTFAWTAPSGAVFTTNNGQIVVQPGSLPVGVHHFELVVTDNGAPPVVSRSTFELVVLETLPALPSGAIGWLPSGLPNHPSYAPTAPNTLPERTQELTHHLMEADPGTQLALGAYARLRNAFQTELQGPTSASSLPIDSVANMSGYFDFVVSDLPRVGESVSVAIPLRAVIPALPVYRKYDPTTNSWRNFVQDDSNRLASAPGEEGFCPPPASALYRNGLNVGDWCVRITIRDGGPNDDDKQANGSVSDPGGIGSLNTVVVTGKSAGGGGFDLWMLMCVMTVGILRAFNRLSFKKQVRCALYVTVGAISTTAVAADSSYWYGGASVGQARSDVSADELTQLLQQQGYAVTANVQDQHRTAFRVHAGYQWTPNVASEAGYVDLGQITTTYTGAIADVPQFLADANRIQPPAATGVDVALVVRGDIGSRISIHARVGLLLWDATFRTSNGDGQSVQRDDRGSDPLIGIGLDVRVHGKWFASSEFTQYRVNDERIDFFGIGAKYRW